MTLQNHIGDLEFPVRARWRWIRVVTETRHRLAPRAEGRRNATAFLVTAVPAGAAAIVGESAWFPSAAADPGLGSLVPPLLIAGSVGFCGLCAASVPRLARPLRDQRRYLGWREAEPLTAEQQSLLALDAPGDHEDRVWNASLERRPSWVLLPREVRERYDDGRRGQPLPSLPMQPPRELRQWFDREFRLASADDVRLAFADRFGARGSSGRLRAALADPRAVARLAALTGVDEPDLLELARDRGSRPAPLVWAADVQRAVLLVRLAVETGLLEEPEAWRLLRRAGDIAAVVYDGWPDYDRGLLIGTALATDEVGAVDLVRDSTDQVRSGSWPAASAAFPRLSAGAVLPPAVQGRWQPV